MYEIPSREDIEKCVVTKETVENNSEPTLVFIDPARKKKPRQKVSRRSSDKTDETA